MPHEPSLPPATPSVTDAAPRGIWREVLLGRDRLATLLALVTAGSYLAWSSSTTLSQEEVDQVVGWVLALAGPGLAWLVWRAAGIHPRGSAERRGWTLLALALLSNSIGDIVAAGYEARGLDPWVSWADPWFLLYPPLTLAGVLCFPLGLRGGRDRLRFVLDAAIGFTGCVMLSWQLVLYPTITAGEENHWALALALAYPLLGYLSALGAVTLALRVPQGDRRWPPQLLAGGFAVLFLADTVWSHQSLTDSFANGGIADTGYIIGFLLLALATLAERAVVRRAAPVIPRDPRHFSIIPYTSALLGYGLLLIAALEGGGGNLVGLVLGAVILTGLVLLRQVAMIQENMALAADRAAAQLRIRLSALIQHSSDVILILTPAGDVSFASPSAAAIVGWDPAELVGRPCSELIDPADRATAQGFLLDVLGHAGSLSGVTWKARHRDGTPVWLEVVGNDLTREPTVGGIVLNLRDVSERNALEQQLVHQAFHDPLTGLANRALFKDRVDHAVELARRAGERIGIMFLDLDNFKTINDSLGHAQGDALLVGVASRLRVVLRQTDTIARLGGDEFAVLLEGVTGETQVAALADRIVEGFGTPFEVGDQCLEVTASIGIALSHEGEGRAELMRNADLAMYVAKSRGRGRHEFFEPMMHDRVRDQLALQADLRGALEGQGLVLEYQPIIDLSSARIVGAEALVRWDHPTRGRLSPAAFIPLAEETGLIGALGAWVLREATREAATWPAGPDGSPPPHVAVNLSPRQVSETGLAGVVLEALQASALPAGRLTLEVTESWLMEHIESAVAVLGELRRLGVRVSMDDFGTGYSSLSRLTELPLDSLKVPKPFVDALRGDGSAPGLAGAILGISRSLGLDVVAEGIESAEQVTALVGLGCPLGQGYHFSRPVPAARFRALLATGVDAAIPA